MRRLVPDLIIANFKAGRLQGSFDAAGMFLDVSGFSAMTDALMGQGREGAEVLANIMRAVFDPLVEAIFGHGGMVVGYAGDSISALFPYEGDDEPAMREALAAAKTIQQELTARPSFETAFGRFHISAKIGMAAGQVSWGILRSRDGERAAYYFRGPALEEAARAEQKAVAGDIVLAGGMRERFGVDLEARPVAGFHAVQEISGRLPAAREIAQADVDAAASAAFTPREVMALEAAGEFRPTVHAFIRLPEPGDQALRKFMEDYFDLQSRYGGWIDRIDFGDKGCNMVAVWGAPLAQENDIERVLEFALDMQRYAAFPITAGITYYMSYAGFTGASRFETYSAYGWGISLAARLMMAAPPGSVWVDEGTFQRARHRFVFDSLGERSFKGFAQKQEVYALRGRWSRAEMLFRGRWAGRSADLQRLAEFVAPLWGGKEAGVMGVWGEAGIGKSRLVFEFQRGPGFEERACLWALCQADDIVRESLNPFRTWLESYFELLPEDDGAGRSGKVHARLDELTGHLGETPLAADLRRGRPFVAALAGAQVRDPAYAQLDAQARFDNAIIALTALIKAESLRQPVVLWIEDAQYLDEDSKAFLPRLKRSLAADARSYPVAILLTGRWPAGRVLLEGGLVDHEMTLDGLSDEAIASASGDLLGQPPSADLTRLVNERAGGNPFFAEQILRFLREQDRLHLDDAGEWRLRPEARAAAIPTDIRAMLIARLDRLARPVRTVVRAAAVLGRVFELRVLERMLEARPTLLHEVAAAEQAAVWSPLGEMRYVFNHALLREVAYGMQLESRRRELHGLALEAVRETCGLDIERHYAELAHHAEQAALPDEALRYLRLAADAARDAYQNAQALDLYRRALAFVPARDAGAQYRLHRERERVLAERGSLEERQAEVDALHALAAEMREPGRVAEVMLLKCGLLHSAGEYDEAAKLAEHAGELAHRAGRRDISVGAHTARLDAFYQRGMYQEALEQGEEGLRLAREAGMRHEEATLLNKLGMAMLEMKNPSTAREYFEDCLRIFRAVDDVRGIARALTNAGIVAGLQGNYATALGYYEQALRLAREFGARKGECALLGNMGWVAGLMGDYRKARQYAEQNLTIAREIGDRYIETFSLINLSSHAGALGDLGPAIEHAEQALALARESEDRNAQAWALTYLGHGLLESSVLERARDAYREALDLRGKLNQPTLAAEPEAGLALISMLQNDRAAARAHVDAILAQLEQDGTLEGTDQPLRVYLSCYLVLEGLQDARARGTLNTARDMLRTRANGIADPAARKVFLEKVTYNRKILSLWQERR